MLVSVSEAKGLDFNSVCVLDAGSQLQQMVKENAERTFHSDVEGLRRRLAHPDLCYQARRAAGSAKRYGLASLTRKRVEAGEQNG